MRTSHKKYALLVTALFLVLPNVICDISISTNDLDIKLNEKVNVTLSITNFTYDNAKLQFVVQHSDIVKITPSLLEINNTSYENRSIQIEALHAGNSEVSTNITVNVSVDDVFLRVTVHKVDVLDTVSLVIGWMYFVAWSVSFYPQIYINYKRQSVVGLNFDFIALNLVGFALYATFNIGLYFIPEIRTEYSQRYPRGLNPVQVNDIVFALHAAFATIITIAQCFIYERAEQRVSITAKSILSAFGAFLIISLILCLTSVLHWLDFLYFCSYVKLSITLIKYIPQAYMNYKRKSTIGWSIGNVLLDFTGGILSMLQMLLNAYNYDDWASIFGDPTKFGLGLFSVVFDIFFIVQHYILYRHTNYEYAESSRL